jgi:hypothetical protein
MKESDAQRKWEYENDPARIDQDFDDEEERKERMLDIQIERAERRRESRWN